MVFLVPFRRVSPLNVQDGEFRVYFPWKFVQATVTGEHTAAVAFRPENHLPVGPFDFGFNHDFPVEPLVEPNLSRLSGKRVLVTAVRQLRNIDTQTAHGITPSRKSSRKLPFTTGKRGNSLGKAVKI
jgi:hypothetical protein